VPMATVAHRRHAPDPESPLKRLSTVRLLGQLATKKLTDATRCRNKQDGRRRQTQTGSYI
jgi:hypothetical protein